MSKTYNYDATFEDSCSGSVEIDDVYDTWINPETGEEEEYLDEDTMLELAEEAAQEDAEYKFQRSGVMGNVSVSLS